MANVKIIHPSDGSVAEVDQLSLPHHYRAGWRLLTDDEEATRDQAAQAALAPEPKPMTKAQAAKAAKAAQAGNEE